MGGRVIQASNFRADAYGYITNQSGHVLIGICTAAGLCWLHLKGFGEFPYRGAVWAVMAAFYVIAVEILGQGWRGGDTIEDSIFVLGYGAGGALYTMEEAAPGGSALCGDLADIMPFIALAALHLSVGAGIRVWQARRP